MSIVAVTGASGFVGSALGRALTAQGHDVRRVARCSTDHGDAPLRWDPATGDVDLAQFAAVDAVVHLAGANVAGGRWTEARRRAIRESRGPATSRLCRTLAQLDAPPTFVSASAIGYYGDRGDEVLTEDSPPGEGFLASVAREWEQASLPLAERGARVVQLRIGMVLGDGGALARMRTPFKLGLGGRLGSGRQFVSWIALEDLVGVIGFALARDDVRGPINATAPTPVRNSGFTKTLARVLRRPAVLPVPAVLLRLGLGQMADALLLASARVEPRRLLDLGYEFRQPDLEAALRAALAPAARSRAGHGSPTTP